MSSSSSVRSSRSSRSSWSLSERLEGAFPLWALGLANAVVIGRALYLLAGGRTSHLDMGMVPFPEEGIRLATMSLDLLGMPGVFLVLAAFMLAAAVSEGVQRRIDGRGLLGTGGTLVLRVGQYAAATPLAVGAAVAGLMLLVQFVIAMVIFGMVLVGVWLIFQVLSS